ncbi:MAG: ABC transporter substrate-binding protein [Defluviitaleaceae bacterium]|nr:ABC transporter substrate-binding protein [Defluviitaleaceae bacterium]MCL2836138.1 ABC transporter substrate-binding protein [Defluviitaleaceae bacterium]
MRRFAALFVVLMCIASAACYTASEPGDRIFRWVTGSVDNGINPHDSALMANGEIVDLILVSLYGWSPAESRDRAELVPRMAAGEPVSEDGITWIISINPGARWANGEPITAQTFIYSWKMGLDPGLAYIASTAIYNARVEIVNAEDYYAQNLPGRETVCWEDVGFKALDDTTLEITTVRRYTAADVMLHFAHRATAPVYEPLYEAGMNAERTSTLYGTSLEYFMANGPFTLTSWTKGSERIFVRNENYLYSHLIRFDGIYGRVAADEITRIELFESGQSDYIELGVNGLMRYEDDPRLVSYNRQAIRTIEVNRDNPDNPALADPLFRKALYYATDRAAVAGLVNAAPAPFFLSTVGIALDDGTLYRDIDMANDWLPPNNGYDPEYAKSLFLEALEKYGMDSVSLTLLYGEDIPGLRAASELIQSQWERVFGRDVFNLSLRGMPHSAVLAMMTGSVEAPSAGWDLGWSARMLRAENFSPHAKFAPYLSTAPNRYTNYGNAFLDEMFPLFEDDEYRLDDLKRFNLTLEIEMHLILEDVTVIPVYQEMAYVMFNSRVRLPLDTVSPIIGFGWEYGDFEYLMPPVQ